jgi:hypothetical protein
VQRVGHLPQAYHRPRGLGLIYPGLPLHLQIALVWLPSGQQDEGVGPVPGSDLWATCSGGMRPGAKSGGQMSNGQSIFLGSGALCHKPCHVLSGLGLRACVEEQRLTLAWGGKGCMGTKLGPSHQLWGRGRKRKCCIWLPEVPPAQLYIVKHHRGAHMPDLYVGEGRRESRQPFSF